MQSRSAWIIVAALCAAVAVAMGAIGAHVLKSRVDAGQLATFEKGAHYQLFHAIGLLVVGQGLTLRPSRIGQLAAWLLFLGILGFSGGIYLYVLGVSPAAVHIVPFGGSAWILGWIVLACSWIKKSSK